MCGCAGIVLLNLHLVSTFTILLLLVLDCSLAILSGGLSVLHFDARLFLQGLGQIAHLGL